MKKRFFSVNYDFKTGFLYSFFIKIGLFLLAVHLSNFLYNFFFSEVFFPSNISDILLALSILSIGLGLIFYIFYRLFEKLSEIAEEIEKEN
ncbi:MAG: hypothetical protein DRN12_01100 [Thermoplasmata archaeon]|nr:MAG: hypothetical protein DRN12_01100 [Thermoplasmata archaeon]